jgi:hypothetical protein
MAWQYTLPRERRMPPCPSCGNLGGIVRLRGDAYVCMDCTPRRAFEAVWSDPSEPLPVSAADLTAEGRERLEKRLAGIGTQLRGAFERGFVEGLVAADARAWFTEWRS